MTPTETSFTAAKRTAARVLAAMAAAWTLTPGLAAAAQASRAHRSSQPPPLRNGRELWATIDVCRAKPHPLIGIRGSMPSDGQRKDTMYMRFRIEYLDVSTKRWLRLASGGESSFVKVGLADVTRQAGRTFDLNLPTHGATYQMRGAVQFQWRRGSRTVLSATRTTSGGRHSTAGAVPPGFSAATCKIGG